MKKEYGPKGISLISFPITSANRYNAKNQPSVELGKRTPFEVFDLCTVGKTGSICCIGSPGRFIGTAKALVRRSGKPFLLIGSDADRRSDLAALEPDWILEHIEKNLPNGNGAIFLKDDEDVYLELCVSIRNWSEDRFVIIQLGTGLIAGVELIDKLKTIEQSLVLCDSLYRSLRDGESREFSPSDFLKKMDYIFIASAGVNTKCLKELLPDYQYLRIVNMSSLNLQNGQGGIERDERRGAIYKHKNHGGAFSQSRTLEPKSVYEEDELQYIFDRGSILIYNAKSNKFFLTDLVK